MRKWETEASALAVHDVREFLAMDIPPRDMLLEPWLESASLAMIFASRGVGKTHVAMHIAHALATGGAFLKWKAKEPVPVLYLDGEMPAPSMQERWKALIAATGTEPAPGMLRLVSRDLQPMAELPNLATPDGQDEISRQLGEARVLIVDNLSSLMHGVKENEAEGWDGIGQWAIKLRAQGRTVVFIHHAGKNGDQRGSSKREDLLDVVIKLERPADYRPEQGARFAIRFQKARSLCGAAVAPFEAHLDPEGSGEAHWRIQEDGDNARLLELRNQGKSMEAIAAELGVNKSTVSRRLERLKGAA